MKADEIQGYADSHDTKCFYDVLKTVCEPQSSGSSHLLNADGMQLLTGKNQILERWADHFNQVLNCPTEIIDKAITSLPEVETNRELKSPPPNWRWSQRSYQATFLWQSTRTRCSPHGNIQSRWAGIDAETDRALPDHVEWRTGPATAKWCHLGPRLQKKMVVAGTTIEVSLSCPLLASSSPMFYWTASFSTLSRVSFLKTSVAFVQDTEQQIWHLLHANSRKNAKSSTGTFFFINLMKAFDTVSRGLWKIMEKFGWTCKFIMIGRQLHDGMMVKVLDDGDESKAFPVWNCEKQGCVLAPTSSNMVFSAMLTRCLPWLPGWATH